MSSFQNSTGWFCNGDGFICYCLSHDKPTTLSDLTLVPHGVPNYQQLDCLIKSLFRLTSGETRKVGITGLLWGESWGRCHSKTSSCTSMPFILLKSYRLYIIDTVVWIYDYGVSDPFIESHTKLRLFSFEHSRVFCLFFFFFLEIQLISKVYKFETRQIWGIW